MENALKLSIISGGILYVYEGGMCKDCSFRESCDSHETICGSLGVCGSFTGKGKVKKIKIEEDEP